jgi:hypothetical protein
MQYNNANCKGSRKLSVYQLLHERAVHPFDKAPAGPLSGPMLVYVSATRSSMAFLIAQWASGASMLRCAAGHLNAERLLESKFGCSRLPINFESAKRCSVGWELVELSQAQ